MCGIVGIFGHPEASTLAYLGLYALQHRGQESAGIVTAVGLLVMLREGDETRRRYTPASQTDAAATE